MKACEWCGEEFEQLNKEQTICLQCEEQYVRQMREEEENRYIEVTREMAMDACDMSLEGQIWKW